MSPARSRAQARLFGAALGGAKFPAAKRLREELSTDQLRDFASGSQKNKPEHVKQKSPLKDYLLRRMTGR